MKIKSFILKNKEILVEFKLSNAKEMYLFEKAIHRHDEYPTAYEYHLDELQIMSSKWKTKFEGDEVFYQILYSSYEDRESLEERVISTIKWISNKMDIIEVDITSDNNCIPKATQNKVESLKLHLKELARLIDHYEYMEDDFFVNKHSEEYEEAEKELEELQVVHC